MLAHARRQKLLAILDKRQRAGSAKLRYATRVSSATLRRDLDFLERQDLVALVHGAVLHPSVASAVPSLLQKSRSAVQAKRKIAAKATTLIPERAIVFIDSGTTCLEAAKIFREQGLRGAVVLTTSANAAVAKKGSVAYDTSKAAANHLVREMAVELAPLVRVNGVAPATVVQGSAMFPRDRVIGSLAKYGIPYSEEESDDSLTTKLAQFYADRTLTKSPITLADQAEAYFLLLSDRLGKTTGQIITIDGGLAEAFLR